jgi:hypothetical protein
MAFCFHSAKKKKSASRDKDWIWREGNSSTLMMGVSPEEVPSDESVVSLIWECLILAFESDE